MTKLIKAPIEVEDSQMEVQPKSPRPGNKSLDEVKTKKIRKNLYDSDMSETLRKFLGTEETKISRSDLAKQMWDYFKRKGLQDPSNKMMIICDDNLKELLGVESFRGLSITSLLSSHFISQSGKGKERNTTKQHSESSHRSTHEATPPLDDSEFSHLVSKKICNKRSSDEDAPPLDKDENEPGEKKKSRYSIPIPISDALINFLGTGETKISRIDLTKRMWDYFKRNGLQNPSDKRRILCDDKLKKLFGVESFVGFTMIKLLIPHFIKESKNSNKRSRDESTPQLDEDEDEPLTKKLKRKKADSLVVNDLKVKLNKKEGSGLSTSHVPLSKALTNFLGTGETQLSQADVTKRMWKYFKQNGLQDPTNKRMIICDDKLKKLLNKESFLGFGILELLSSHLTSRVTKQV